MIKSVRERISGLTDREVAILTIACVQMSNEKGVDPMNSLSVIQVEAGNKGMRMMAFPIGLFSKDQNFNRQTFPKKHAGQRTCCLIPKGRYVVTGPGQWRMLTAKEMGMLQGLGSEDWYRFGMDTLSQFGAKLSWQRVPAANDLSCFRILLKFPTVCFTRL